MYTESRSSKAILLIDMTQEMLSRKNIKGLPSKIDVIRYIEGELSYFREKMRPVFFCHSIRPDGKLAKSIPNLTPRIGEMVCNKNKANAFFNTNLYEALCEYKVDKLTIVGMSSHNDILLTATSALDYGFKVIVPETCLLWQNEGLHDASLKLLSSFIAD